MGVQIIVTRAFDRELKETGESISLEDWREFLSRDPAIQLRTEPWVAVNPRTGEQISIAARQDETELIVDGEAVPFLRYSRGELYAGLNFPPDDQTNPVRKKIAEVAHQFEALIMTDAGDDILDW